jgi:hypothetical protein
MIRTHLLWKRCMFPAVTTQHSERHRSSKSTSDSKAILLVLDSSATRLVPKIDFCSLVNAIRATSNLILAMMVSLSSKFLLSIESRCLNSGTTSASPSPILIGRIASPHRAEFRAGQLQDPAALCTRRCRLAVPSRRRLTHSRQDPIARSSSGSSLLSSRLRCPNRRPGRGPPGPALHLPGRCSSVKPEPGPPSRRPRACARPGGARNSTNRQKNGASAALDPHPRPSTLNQPRAGRL